MHGERLRELMADLDRLSRQAGYSHELRLEQRQKESVQVAVAMEESVAKLRDSVDQLQLAGAERDAFLRMVAKLERHTKQFHQACRIRDLDGMSTALKMMMVSCNTCHGTFREMAP